MVQDLQIMSFNHSSSTDTDMCSALRILVCVALVFAATVAANDRSKRSGLIDLGTSVSLPWESSNNQGLRNKIYNTVPNSEILRIRNIGNQYANERNERQQSRLRDLVRLSNDYNIRKQYQAQGGLSSVTEDSRRQYSNGRYGQSGLQQQNGYTGLGSYSTFTNPSVDEEQSLIGRNGQRQSQYLDQARKYQLNQQSLGDDGQSNIQLNKIISLGGQVYRSLNQGQRSGVLKPSNIVGVEPQGALINSGRLNRYRQLSDAELGLSGRNVQQKNLLSLQLNQDGLINSGRLIQTNKLGQNIGQSNGALNEQYLVRANEEALEQENNQQANADLTQELINENIARNHYQSLRSLENQQLYRPVQVPITQALIHGNGQYPLNERWNLRRPSAQIGGDVQYRQQLEAENSNPEANPELVAAQLQNQQVLNQQQPNVYTYGELNAKIWNVIKSNPAMISNLENLGEQLSNGGDSGDQQMNQLKALLQEARKYNRNIIIPAQSPEEQERNAVVSNLIYAMEKNQLAAEPVDIRGQNLYGRW